MIGIWIIGENICEKIWDILQGNLLFFCIYHIQ
jgi:hypothetical protein